MDPLPNVNKVYAQTMKEEKHQSFLVSKTSPDSAAFIAKPTRKIKDPNKAKNKWDHCGRLGHYADDCLKSKGIQTGGKRIEHNHHSREL